MTAVEYRKQNNILLKEYEYRTRKWLSKIDPELSEIVPFMKDGIVCPEVWFEEGNTFRPLIVLKEVSLGINSIKELDNFLEIWGHQKTFEFVENPFDDVRIGTFPQWQRIARLIKGLEEIHNGEDCCDYYKYDFAFKPGGGFYKGNIEGYRRFNCEKTSNSTYNDIINKMALMEIKKLGAGQTVSSDLSIKTGYYTEHINPFIDLLCRQIELIDPTIIVCCGRENGCISELLKNVRQNTKKRIWIDGYHHTRSSNRNFYYEPLAIYKELKDTELNETCQE